MNKSVLIFIALLSSLSPKAQYILNFESAIVEQHIKNLIICPDSNLMACPISTLEFDQNGRVYSMQQGSSEAISFYFYDSTGYVKIGINGFKNDSGKIDTTLIEYYKPHSSGKDSSSWTRIVQVDILLNKTTTIVRKNKPNKLVNPIFCEYGVLEHEVKNMNFPCHTPYEGSHKLVYHYLNNRLISQIEVIPLTDKGRKQTWYFLYNKF